LFSIPWVIPSKPIEPENKDLEGDENVETENENVEE
jgi:hypothetical protein